jgi:hypothetical protein
MACTRLRFALHPHTGRPCCLFTWIHTLYVLYILAYTDLN